jgi:hypothetical protein
MNPSGPGPSNEPPVAERFQLSPGSTGKARITLTPRFEMTEDRPARPAELLAMHPHLREVMDRSSTFAAIKQRATLNIDDQVEYIVRDDTLGDEDELFVEALLRGASSSEPADPYRALYMELDEDARAIIDQRTRK